MTVLTLWPTLKYVIFNICLHNLGMINHFSLLFFFFTMSTCLLTYAVSLYSYFISQECSANCFRKLCTSLLSVLFRSSKIEQVSNCYSGVTSFVQSVTVFILVYPYVMISFNSESISGDSSDLNWCSRWQRTPKSLWGWRKEKSGLVIQVGNRTLIVLGGWLVPRTAWPLL